MPGGRPNQLVEKLEGGQGELGVILVQALAQLVLVKQRGEPEEYTLQ
jgi:hypothetical protein